MMHATVVLMCALARVASSPQSDSDCEGIWCIINPLLGVKPGNCPPIRVCPQGGHSERPRSCLNDRSCSGSDKCCYDSCLRYAVCKPAQ
ncbi:porwaprin-b-like [Oratosquilla oratoria]|uniref:porwaprin-b-like n=1 Tax=Oratosquilla oratoria TaxID=337810 RepID=UPI003F75DC13